MQHSDGTECVGPCDWQKHSHWAPIPPDLGSFPKENDSKAILRGLSTLANVPKELLCLNAEILGPQGWYQ